MLNSNGITGMHSSCKINSDEPFCLVISHCGSVLFGNLLPALLKSLHKSLGVFWLIVYVVAHVILVCEDICWLLSKWIAFQSPSEQKAFASIENLTCEWKVTSKL
jgi:hypothetical protein